MSAQLAAEYPLSVVCAVLETPRSTLYARRRCALTSADSAAEAALRAHIARISGEWPTYGYRRVTAQLRREGAGAVNGKQVRRLMGALGLAGHAPVQRCRTTNSDHPYPRYPNLVMDLAITHPDMVWVADITYVRLQQDFVYLAVLMDVYTRAIRGWELSRHLDQRLTLTALERAVGAGQQPGIHPDIHHSDQGAQYAALAYTARLEQLGAQISMAEEGEPRQNGYAGRLMRTIKEEEVALTEYRNFADAYAQIGRFLDDVYQRKRIHSALGYLTPAEFEAAYHAGTPPLGGIP